MIEKINGYKASDGTVHETIEGAQIAELTALFDRECSEPGDACASIARLVIKNKTAILDILTTGPKSRPKARAVNGAKRTRVVKPNAFPVAPEVA